MNRRALKKKFKKPRPSNEGVRGPSVGAERKAMEGNQMKMREALVEIRDAINKWYGDDYISHGVFSVLWDLCSDALSAPPRQCDVGTADDQSLRFNDFCMKHHCDSDTARCKCKFETGRARCELAWAQTPYAAEEGDGK